MLFCVYSTLQRFIFYKKKAATFPVLYSKSGGFFIADLQSRVTFVQSFKIFKYSK
jgi:hypothetical protein